MLPILHECEQKKAPIVSSEPSGYLSLINYDQQNQFCGLCIGVNLKWRNERSLLYIA